MNQSTITEQFTVFCSSRTASEWTVLQSEALSSTGIMTISWSIPVEPETQITIDRFLKLLTLAVKKTYHVILLPVCTFLLISYLTWYIGQRIHLNIQLRKKKNYLKVNIEKIRSRLRRVKVNSDLTRLDLNELKQKLHQGHVKPIEVLQAYQSKALELYDRGNSGICEFILEAEQQALDLALLSNRDQLPLYGIPISIKELCPIAGYDCTYGLVKRCNQPQQEDCVIVKALKAQGAIPFVLTTTTQLAMGATGYNPIFGDSTHPLSSGHEPGGSSCGEAVLLALNGSPVGLGTDAAGSIRIPACFCGLAGIKPTRQRISCQGMDSLHPDHVCLLASGIGPMGRKTDDLAEICRALFQPAMFSLDQSLPPLLFNETLYAGLDKPKLRIGYFDTIDGPNLVQTVPSVRRAVHEAVEILKSMGHEVVRFEPPNCHKALLLALRLGYASGTSHFHKALYAEPSNRHTVFLKLGLQLPHCIRYLIDQVSGPLVGKPASIMRTMSGPRNLKNCLRLLVKIETYRHEFARAWDQTGPLDALICPVAAFPAFPKSASSVYLLPSVVYVVLYNLLDYPAGTVRIGHVNQEDVDQAARLCNSKDCQVSQYQKKVLEMQTHSLGLPLGVQVVAKPYREELVLRVMKELEQSVQARSGK